MCPESGSRPWKMVRLVNFTGRRMDQKQVHKLENDFLWFTGWQWLSRVHADQYLMVCVHHHIPPYTTIYTSYTSYVGYVNYVKYIVAQKYQFFVTCIVDKRYCNRAHVILCPPTSAQCEFCQQSIIIKNLLPLNGRIEWWRGNRTLLPLKKTTATSSNRWQKEA